MKKLLLLDGNSMLFRAYYATLYTHRMTTSNGIPTNAVYGFVMMLNKAIDVIEPDKILVAWDAGKPTFRHKQFEAYKGTRKPLDEELIVQLENTWMRLESNVMNKKVMKLMTLLEVWPNAAKMFKLQF